MSSDAKRDRHSAGEQAAARTATPTSGESILTRTSLRGSIMTTSSLRGSILTGGSWRDSGASARARVDAARRASATRPSDERARQVLAEARRRADELLGPSPTLPGTRSASAPPRPPQAPRPPASDPRAGYATGAPAAYTAATESNSAPARTAITPTVSSSPGAATPRRRSLGPLAYIGPLIALTVIIGGLATSGSGSTPEPGAREVPGMVTGPGSNEWSELGVGETLYGSEMDVTVDAPRTIDNMLPDGRPMVLVPVRILNFSGQERTVPLELSVVTTDGIVGDVALTAGEDGGEIDGDAIVLPADVDTLVGVAVTFDEQPDLESLEIFLRLDNGQLAIFR